MKSFKLQIMASNHTVYDGEAESVSLMTTEGSIGILADHSNLIMARVPGPLEYVPVPASEGRQSVVVSEGLLKVENGEVMIFVDTAEDLDDIDAARADLAAARAKEDLKRQLSRREYIAARAELSRAMSRLKATSGRKGVK